GFGPVWASHAARAAPCRDGSARERPGRAAGKALENSWQGWGQVTESWSMVGADCTRGHPSRTPVPVVGDALHVEPAGRTAPSPDPRSLGAADPALVRRA